MVRAEDVIRIHQSLSVNGIQVWLTGGWGIDALLGEQTRQHKDLDIQGKIAGVAVRRITAEMQVLCHTGYQLPPEQVGDQVVAGSERVPDE
jgi:hypothetical protein